MDLSIIIVNWNSKDYLNKCLTSIFNNVCDLSFEVIVIDSASYDGCDELIKKDYPQVIFIQSHDNLGFAKSNNIAYKYSSGEFLLFLNPDTEVLDKSVNVLFHYLNSNSSAGAVGPKLLNSDHSIQTSCVRVFPTILNQITDVEFFIKFFYKSKLFATSYYLKETNSIISVNAVSGSCIMIKRDAFIKVGLFSIDYFMYSEDIDLCHKLYLAGFKTLYIPYAEVIHHGGISSSRSNISTFSEIMFLHSRQKYFNKFMGKEYTNLYKISMSFNAILRIFIIMIGWPLIKNKSESLKNILNKWIYRFRWTIGIETFPKTFDS